MNDELKKYSNGFQIGLNLEKELFCSIEFLGVFDLLMFAFFALE